MLRTPPSSADTLRRIADDNPNFPVGRLTYRHEAWFALPDGETMLCRSDFHVNADSPTGEWWQFREEGGQPRLTRRDGWLSL